ncbi:MAG: 50S ribosomal protein L31 [Minisyncoccia bacterium]
MKQNIHPKYYPNAKVICACGNSFTIGATVPEIKVEICSNCHPFYTGSNELIDVAGRVEKFNLRKQKATTKTKTAKTKKSSKKTQTKTK